MSTFNGQRYVKAQLQSILEQLPAGGCIRVRDDGSSDDTVAAIRAVNDDRISLKTGPNCGFGASFLTLLAAAPADADMVMFADQDDVWMPGKIDRAWRHLHRLGNVPGLYGSGQLLVDEALRPLHPTPPWAHGPSFANALTENIITGCTAALNRPALALLQRAGVPQGVRLHDWWLYLVISAFGTVVHDEHPTLLYRQHGANQIGHGAGWLGRYRGILSFLMRNDWVGILLAQVRALQHHYGDALSPAARDLVLGYFGDSGGKTVPRWSLIFSARRWRQNPVMDLMLRVLLLLHRLHLWPVPGRRL